MASFGYGKFLATVAENLGRIKPLMESIAGMAHLKTDACP
jgi:hypothetical protein